MTRKFFKKIQIIITVITLCLVNTSVFAESDFSDPKQVIRMIESLNWITEEYPPYNYRDPATDKITGISVEVLEKIFNKLGVSSKNVKLKIYPWARGYHKVLNDPGTVLFSTTYTPERQQQMKFIGPIAPNIVAVVAPKSSQLLINSSKDLSKLKIGVVRDDIGEQLLLSQGVDPESIDQLNTGLSMVKKLASGRIDAVAYAHATTELLFKTANIEPNDFEIIYVLKKSDMGYAFHRSTDERLLQSISNVLDGLIADGTLAQIQAKYNLVPINE